MPNAASIQKISHEIQSMPAGANRYNKAIRAFILIFELFLGYEWVLAHINPKLQQWHASGKDVSEEVIRLYTLAEMLFNLRDVEGFEAPLQQLKTNNLDDAFAEFETGRLLYSSSIKFRYTIPQNKKGFDYDIEIKLNSGDWVPADTKNKADEFSEKSILGTLERARSKNLPKDRPGFIFLRINETSMVSDEQKNLVTAAIRRFTNAHQTRIASIKMHGYFYNRAAGQKQLVPICFEAINKKCRFPYTPDWLLFSKGGGNIITDYQWPDLLTQLSGEA